MSVIRNRYIEASRSVRLLQPPLWAVHACRGGQYIRASRRGISVHSLHYLKTFKPRDLWCGASGEHAGDQTAGMPKDCSGNVANCAGLLCLLPNITDGQHVHRRLAAGVAHGQLPPIWFTSRDPHLYHVVMRRLASCHAAAATRVRGDRTNRI